jgi:hypothetical protein
MKMKDVSLALKDVSIVVILKLAINAEKVYTLRMETCVLGNVEMDMFH